jgi:hypothetical protein
MIHIAFSKNDFVRSRTYKTSRRYNEIATTISLIPYTSADDKIKMLQYLRIQSNNITTFKQNRIISKKNRNS